MTNKPMLSVERELLERAASAIEKHHGSIQWVIASDLRAIIDKQVNFLTPDCPDCACVQDGQCLCIPSKPADHPQCEECKGWGYHENHHEGGGTECGACGGSGKAPVSVVMPEPYSLAMFQMISGFESVTPEQFDLVWSACRSEVARLNGVKP